MQARKLQHLQTQGVLRICQAEGIAAVGGADGLGEREVCRLSLLLQGGTWAHRLQ